MPFCFHKCHYCDFYSVVEPSTDPALARDRRARFTQRLIAELEFRAGQTDLKPTTIFVGGGTPTLLEPELWQDLLHALARLGILERVTEFTVEANPETLTPLLLSVLAHGGVNRVSIGAQSFSTALLKTLERWHEPQSVANAVPMVRAAGIDNINLDLIFAIPGETLDLLEADLDAVLALRPDHVSCYNLTYEPDTALTKRLRLGLVKPFDEEVESAMYQRVIDRLAAANFEHYEISNWARREPATTPSIDLPPAPPSPDPSPRGSGVSSSFAPSTSPDAPSRRCFHNLAYWQGANWLGVGPGAASHVAGRRWKNRPSINLYMQEAPAAPIQDHELLPEPRQVGERLMMRLRLLEGAPLPWLDEQLPALDPRHATLDELIAIGMIERTATHLRLTARGLFVADAVVAKLL